MSGRAKQSTQGVRRGTQSFNIWAGPICAKGYAAVPLRAAEGGGEELPLDGEVVGVILCGGALVRFGPAHLLFFRISAFVSFLFSFFFPFYILKMFRHTKTKQILF
jgi:hypothetical protein